MKPIDLIPLLTVAGTLLLVVTGLLNFTVFLRQLRAARDQLDTARLQLESARQQPQIQLVQRAMQEVSEHLAILIERPYLRPYFYEGKVWSETDKAERDEVKAMAELLLNNFASAIIHSAAFEQYPAHGVLQTIRFHLRQSPAMREHLRESFDRFPLSGLALICLMSRSKAEAEASLRALIPAADDAWETARRERLLEHLHSTDKAEALELAKYSLEKESADATLS